jgi:hypothetical protein
MIVIRNVFHLKFGKTREALAVLKEGIAIQKRAGAEFNARLLTDITGPFYTIVLELTVPGMSYFETDMPKMMSNPDWQANYQKLLPLVESGHRKLYTLIE